MGDALKEDQNIINSDVTVVDLRDLSDICEQNLTEYTVEQLEQALNEWDGNLENAPNSIQRLINENKDNTLIQVLLRNHKRYLEQTIELLKL